MRAGRRTFLALPGLGVAVLALSACNEEAPVAPADGKFEYGDDPSQFGELYLPDGEPRGVVVVIHGGFWQAAYDLELGRPLATSLAAEGWAAWNLEYRRVGNGGGTPETFDDVAAGIDKLVDLDLDLTTVVTLGHSAGGHLATWAASRGRFSSWQPEKVPVTAVISQSGVLDLRAAHDDGLGGGAVQQLLGRPPGEQDEPLDPARQIPLDVPVWCVHGTDDQIVPISQSKDYVAAATEAGGQATLVEVDGDHFVVIDANSQAWRQTLAVLDELG